MGYFIQRTIRFWNRSVAGECRANLNQQSASAAIANAKQIGDDTGNGRLDVFLAVESVARPSDTD